MNRRTMLALCSLVCALAVPVSAQETRATSVETRVEPTIYNITDADTVVGATASSTTDLIHVRRSGPRVSIIQLRQHFVSEMLKSVEGL